MGDADPKETKPKKKKLRVTKQEVRDLPPKKSATDVKGGAPPYVPVGRTLPS